MSRITDAVVAGKDIRRLLEIEGEEPALPRRDVGGGPSLDPMTPMQIPSGWEHRHGEYIKHLGIPGRTDLFDKPTLIL